MLIYYFICEVHKLICIHKLLILLKTLGWNLRVILELFFALNALKSFMYCTNIFNLCKTAYLLHLLLLIKIENIFQIYLIESFRE